MAQWKEAKRATTTPVAETRRKEADTRPPRTENILFIGSEFEYQSFWLQMMFVGAAYRVGSGGALFRPCERLTIAYVDYGYSFLEKLTIEQLGQRANTRLVALASQSDLVACINSDRHTFKIQDMAFFCHGLPGKIELNYNSSPRIRMGTQTLSQFDRRVFMAGGKIYSYACRTGNASYPWQNSFSNDDDVHPEQSLAQQLSDHFNVEVHAFLRRTNYGAVLRERSDSLRISAALRAGRQAHGDLGVINIPPEHEALPHPGLANSGFDIGPFERGPVGEGTDNFALWRKMGGLNLPVAGDTPTGLSASMRRFVPNS